MNYIKEKIKSEKGITLVALVVTIIILIILAGISINALVGQNGLIEKAKQAKEKTLVAQYKEQIELIKAEARLQYGNETTLANIKELLDKDSQKSWVNSTEMITDDDGTEKIKLTTNDKFIFYITEETTEFKGANGKVVVDTSKITITANPNNKTDEVVLTISVDIDIDFTENITSSTGYYAWKKGTTEGVASNEWKTLTIEDNGDKGKKSKVIGSADEEGSYFLWIKVIVNGKEEIKSFGEYKLGGKPTVEDLVLKIVGKSENDTKGEVEIGSSKAFTGWKVTYTINGVEQEEIPVGTTKTINITKADLVSVKYSKEGETAVTKTLNTDELRLSASMFEFTPSSNNAGWSATTVQKALDDLYSE